MERLKLIKRRVIYCADDFFLACSIIGSPRVDFKGQRIQYWCFTVPRWGGRRGIYDNVPFLPFFLFPVLFAALIELHLTRWGWHFYKFLYHVSRSRQEVPGPRQWRKERRRILNGLDFGQDWSHKSALRRKTMRKGLLWCRRRCRSLVFINMLAGGQEKTAKLPATTFHMLEIRLLR